MSIDEHIISIIANHTGIAPQRIYPEALLVEELGLDSLYVLELVVAFEYEFGIEIKDEDIKNLKRVRDIIEFVENRTLI